MLFICAMVSGIAIFAISLNARHQRRDDRLEALARELGLEVPAPNAMTSRSFGGSIDGISVRGEHYPGDTDMDLFLVTVGGHRALPGDFSIARRTPLIERALTGDPEFDRAFAGEGDPTRLSSSLTAPIREAFFAFPADAYISLDYGNLTARMRLTSGPAACAALVRSMIALVHQFSADDAPPAERLARELRSANSSGLATTTFRRLMQSRPPEAIAREAVEYAIRSDDPALQALAASHARPQHAERLREIFHRSGSDDILRAAALHALRRIYEPPPMDLPVLLASAGPHTREAVAVFLGADDRTTNEPLLISLLSDAEPEVQAAAARSLARMGTVLAVAPLRTWAQGLFRSVEIKELAEESIRAIQSRASNRGAGQLSLASGSGSGSGAVSIAENKKGALSESAGATGTEDPDPTP